MRARCRAGVGGEGDGSCSFCSPYEREKYEIPTIFLFILRVR